MHSDDTYESLYAWEYGGCRAPDWGSFAERYEGHQQVAAIVLDLTEIYWDSGRLDACVWDDDDGRPGEVVRLVADLVPSGLPPWPLFSRQVFELEDPPCVQDSWWVGYWGNWPGYYARFYVGADLNGPGGGSPMTKIAPGQGYPTGWQDVDIVWGQTAALGIGAEVEDCPTPVESPTWGAVKALFRR
jgi:hypothetical protein